MHTISPHRINKAAVTVPGSKSYTHRVLIASALSDGVCTVRNFLNSEDTNHTLSALQRFGINVEKKSGALTIIGKSGKLAPCDEPVYLGNSGTSMRLLIALAAIGDGSYVLTGSKRMQQRPVQALLDGLNQIGVHAVSLNKDGCPPVRVTGGQSKGGTVYLDCSVSSQYLSALLLIAPCLEQGLKIAVSRGPVSKPYIDMTVDILSGFGIRVIRKGYEFFDVSGGQAYQPGDHFVEPDCSQAGYFWAAAAITGAEIKVLGVSKKSSQGDVRFVDILESMGCRVVHDDEGISVAGGTLSGIEVDMADMPDLVPTLAVVAAFARGTTRIKNVAHLKAKESDRLAAVTCELRRMGVSAIPTENDLVVVGGRPKGAVIETYNDHRIAMSFAVAGLVVPGMRIKDETCVEKSFPGFWDVFDSLYGL